MLLLTLTAAVASASAAPQPPPQRAFWVTHDEVDYLDNLPRTYTCDELYYKYRDILLRLGARPDMTIYTYGCTGSKGAEAARPHVDLKYTIAQPIPPQLSSNSPLRARLETLEIGADKPKVLSQDDCALMEDMRQTVLSSISKDIEVKGAPCGRRHHQGGSYTIFVQALIPLDPSTPAVAGQ